MGCVVATLMSRITNDQAPGGVARSAHTRMSEALAEAVQVGDH